MKRFCAIVLLTVALLTMDGCSGNTVAVVEKGSYTVCVGEELLTVDPVKGTITAENGDVYTYVIADNSVTFTYPNGHEYFWNYTSGVGTESLDGNPDGYRYLNGLTLETAVEREIDAVKPARNPGHLFFALLCFLIGILNIVFPYAGWYLKYGWRFRDAEPSDAVLTMNRVAGFIAVIIGFIFLFI